MQRWITVLGMVVSCILAVTAFGISIMHLVALNDLWVLFYTIPGAFIGTVLMLYFAHEFLLTFNAFARFADTMWNTHHIDWDSVEFVHEAAIERANKLQALKMKMHG